MGGRRLISPQCIITRYVFLFGLFGRLLLRESFHYSPHDNVDEAWLGFLLHLLLFLRGNDNSEHDIALQVLGHSLRALMSFR